MTSTLPQTTNITIRPLHRRDLEESGHLFAQELANGNVDAAGLTLHLEQVNRWYGVLKLLSLFPNPLQNLLRTYVAEQEGQIRGVIVVSPFNRTRSTWKVDQVLVSHASGEGAVSALEVGSLLLRHCFQAIWEARTWLIEVDVNHSDTLALYRHNGFQPLAHITYWDIAADVLAQLADREPDLPNLLPVSNADAVLLHQLDTVSMPPLVRQVFDRHTLDFRSGLFDSAIDNWKHRMNNVEAASGYIFEPQRKAAIGFYELQLNRSESQPHEAKLTVHPAYTWLYPELLSQMARVTRSQPQQSLRLSSADYHPEREECLEQIGATRIEHTLMMSRSVWHKVRESRFVSLEGLQLSEVLQSLQPSRKPVPGRFSLDNDAAGFQKEPPKPKPGSKDGGLQH